MRATEGFVEQSVEMKANLKDFAIKQGFGAYCTFTDASLVGKEIKKDDYKMMGAGQIQFSDEVPGVVSIFAEAADGPEFKSMVGIINSRELKPKAVR